MTDPVLFQEGSAIYAGPGVHDKTKAFLLLTRVYDAVIIAVSSRNLLVYFPSLLIFSIKPVKIRFYNIGSCCQRPMIQKLIHIRGDIIVWLNNSDIFPF